MTARSRLHVALSRAVGIAFGIGTQLAFLITVPYLFLFLRFGSARNGGWFVIDSLLSLQFCVPHSVLLLPSVRKWSSSKIASQLYGSLFAGVTCATLWPIFIFWRGSPVVIWEAKGWLEAGVVACFYLSWVALFLSLSISGFGYQTGWTQWLYWLRHEPLPRRPLREAGPYRWMRHPVYLSFLGLIWFTPRMTADHAILTATWTGYIYIGSCLKDRRMLFYLGSSYLDYARRVPGYPGVPLGPLAKWPATPADESDLAGTDRASRRAA